MSFRRVCHQAARPEPLTTTPENLKELRKLAGLSLREAGRRSGVWYTSLSKYERGLLDLRPADVLRLERVLRKAARERATTLLAMIGGGTDSTTARTAVV